MKIDSLHAEHMSGNAVSSTVISNSIVSRDVDGDVHASKFKSEDLELTHDVPTSGRTTDTVFYSSVDDVIRKNTLEGFKTSLGLENSATIAATSTNTASNIVMRDTNGDFSAGSVTVDNIGIGVTSPAYTLDVGGSANVGALTTTDINAITTNSNLVGDNVTAVTTNSNLVGDNVTAVTTNSNLIAGNVIVDSNLIVNTDDLVVDTVNSRVGIGTTSPSGKLGVYTGSTTTVGLSLDRYPTENYRTDIYQNSYGPDFKVGYATYTPSSILYLKRLADGTKEVEINGNVHISSGTSGDCVLKLEADTDNNDETDNPRIEFISDGGYNTALVGAGQMPFSSTNDNALVLAAHQTKFYTGIQDFTDSTNMLERMCIASNGNVGIGTTAPLTKLHIPIHDSHPVITIANASNPMYSSGIGAKWETNVGQGLCFFAGQATNNSSSLTPSHTRMFISAQGNVGIGTTTFTDTRNTGGLHLPNSKGISIAADSSQTNSRHWRIRNDDYSSWGSLQISVSDNNSTHPDASDEHVMTMTKERYVGIRTSSPSCPLHVDGYDSGSTGAVRYFNYSSGMSGADVYLNNVSLRTSHGILSGDYVAVSSDERIKKNIIDADDAECLDTLRLLKPKKYRYRDEITKGADPVWGFIAQEVRETLPHATLLQKNTIPNIYELANVSSSNVITFTNFNTADLESNATTLIRTSGPDDVQHEVHLMEIIDAHSIRVEEDLSDWIGSLDESGNVVAGNQLFVYGQEVDDFVFLKKEAIWTVATAALQEVDRQQQADKVRIAELESRIIELEGMVSLIKHNMTWPDE